MRSSYDTSDPAEWDPPAVRPDAAKLREQIAAAFRHRPNEERPGDQTPGEIADRVLAVLAEHGLVDRDV